MKTTEPPKASNQTKRVIIIEKPSVVSGTPRQIESYNLEMLASFQCAGCGEWNETTVDETAGLRQSYIEDCQVCCKPNVLQAEYDRASGVFVIGAELE